jgi:predicted outer membrane repeat protein
MSFSSWLRNHSAKRAPRGPARQRRAGARFRPQFEVLEGRVVPSNGPTILTVNSLVDSAKGNTLRNAILQADKDTNKTYEIDISVAGTILLESSLPDLANNITIKGMGVGQTLIQRDTLAAPFRIVTVDAGWTVGLSQMSIAQGSAGSGNGGAIDNFGDLTLTNCNLYSNSALNGGALENEAGASLTAIGTIFSGNQAGTYTGTTPGYGGGIDNNGTLAVSGGSSFTTNSATDGGGINNNGALTVTSALFQSNHATNQTLTDYGGAIDNNGASPAQVSYSTFSSNEADNYGGAIFNTTIGKLAATGCQFQTNQVPFGYGGAIANSGTITVDPGTASATFTGNTASGYGGAIINFGTATVTAAFATNTAISGGAIENWFGASLTISAGSSFTGNTANFGGAIDSQAGGALLAVSGTSFTNNTAVFFGGAIDTHSAGATFSGCIFTGNHALGVSNGGGAIWNDGSVTVGSNSSFTGNTAAYAGGAIDNFGTATVTQTGFGNGTTAGANSAVFGGAIMNWSAATLSLGAGANFNDNQTVNGYGGAIYNIGTVTTSGGSFSNNSALSGGAIYNFGTVTTNGGSFSSNQATNGYGGAIYNAGTVSASGTSFTSNSALSGGAIINYGTVTTSGGSFSNNQATNGYGGAIYNAGTVSASGTSFTSNTALDGGAIINYSDATVSGCTFTFNHSTGTGHDYDGGGAIWSEGSLTVQSNCNFSFNTAAVEGGAIFNFTFGGAVTATVSQSAFDYNSAGNAGGAVMNWTGTTLTVNAGTTFTGNHAISGGAIFNQGTLSATGATFGSNHASGGGFGYGGALDNTGSATLTTCGFTNNTADTGGGALDNVFGTMTVSGCQLSSNSAEFGGGIVQGGGVVNVVAGTQITGNTATVSGGGIYTEAGGVTNILGSFVSGNGPDDTHTVTSDGSVLNVDATSIVIVQTTS